MYIIVGIPTTRAAEAFCARHMIIRAAQHILVNARCLGIGCYVMVNNYS
jgi:hypothetical protein